VECLAIFIGGTQLTKLDELYPETALTHARLKSLLDYDPVTGEFRWRVKRGWRVKGGAVAGCINIVAGSWHIGIDGRLYAGHRLAWFYMTGAWPASGVKHHDGQLANNAWSNLYERKPLRRDQRAPRRRRLPPSVTRARNEANSKARANNKLGVKGVIQMRSGKYSASIKINGKTKYLGTTDDLSLAADLYRTAAAKLDNGLETAQ
jgi:hypothetical protein